jgi:hypothetical protein
VDEPSVKITVSLGEEFKKAFNNFPKQDRVKIYDFIRHVQNKGFEGLTGRNKSSDNVDKNDPYFKEKACYAIENKLYHYHIGIPHYKDSTKGDKTSEYVLHYILVSDTEIRIVDMDNHPPFRLPTQKYLK